MSTASNGAARERRVRDHLIRKGWVLIMRSAGSKGPADIAMAHPVHGLGLFQIGTAASKRLGPGERAAFLLAADMCGALAVVALCGPGKPPRYLLATRDKPGTWEEFTP